MPNFTSYPSTFHNGGVDTCIGPDGNLWVVDITNNITRFNTTTFVSTTFTITTGVSSPQFVSIVTDGTYLYVADVNSANDGNVMIWRLTTSGTSSAFYTSNQSAGSLYFDGTDIWMTSRYNTAVAFTQLDLSGSVVAQYSPGAINHGGGLLNDGTYWYSGEYSSGGGNGFSEAPVASPGAWNNVVAVNTPTKVSALAGGQMWFGDLSPDFYSVAPGTFAITPYSVSGIGQTGQLCFDGTNLWATDGDPSSGGIWKTTPGAPTVGVFYGFTGGSRGALTIIYDAPTKTLWATGNDPAFTNYVFSLFIGVPSNPLIMLV